MGHIEYKGQKSVFKSRMTDTVFNFATTSSQVVPMIGVVDINRGGFVTVGNAVTIPSDGIYDISAHVDFREAVASGTARNNTRFQFYLNGAQTGPRFQNNYLRDSQGHNEVSQSSFLLQEFSAGDVVDLRCIRVSGTGGTVRIETSNGFLSVKAV